MLKSLLPLTVQQGDLKCHLLETLWLGQWVSSGGRHCGTIKIQPTGNYGVYSDRLVAFCISCIVVGKDVLSLKTFSEPRDPTQRAFKTMKEKF